MALVAAGLILTSLYRQSVEQAFDERLNVYLQTLVGALGAEDPSQPFSDPGNLGEQRFELLYSGWYWQVRDAGTGQVVLGSRLAVLRQPRHRQGDRHQHERRRHQRRVCSGPDRPVAALPLPQSVTLEGNRTVRFPGRRRCRRARRARSPPSAPASPSRSPSSASA